MKKGTLRAVILSACLLPTAAARAATDTWVSADSGDWEINGNWSLGKYPNNNPSLGTSYDAVIDATGAAYTVGFSTGFTNSTQRNTQATINSLLLNSANATLHIGNGALHVLNGITINAGTLDIDNGYLSARIGGTGGTFLLGTRDVTLDNVTLARNAQLRAAYYGDGFYVFNVTVENGLTLDNGSITSKDSQPETLLFTGSQTLGGTGTITAPISVSGGTLTVASGVTVRNSRVKLTAAGTPQALINEGSFVYDDALSPGGIGDVGFVNRGLVRVTGGATATFNDASQFASGTSVVDAGSKLQLNLPAGHRVSDLGSITTNGTGRFVVGGVLDDPSDTVATSASLSNIDLYATLTRTHVDNSFGGSLRIAGGSFDGVTVDGAVAWSPGGGLELRNVLTLNSGSTLGSTATGSFSGAIVAMSGAKVVGSGTLELGNGSKLSGADFGIAPTILIRASGANAVITGTGTGVRPRIDGRIDVTGSLQTSNVTTTGPLTVGTAGTLSLGTGDYRASAATIATGGRINLDGVALAMVPDFSSTTGEVDVTAPLTLNGGTLDTATFGPKFVVRTDTGGLSNGTLVLSKPISFSSGSNGANYSNAALDHLTVASDMTIALPSRVIIPTVNGLQVQGKLTLMNAWLAGTGMETIQASGGIALTGNASLVGYALGNTSAGPVTIDAASVDVTGAGNTITDDARLQLAFTGTIHVHGAGSSLQFSKSSTVPFTATLLADDHAQLTLNTALANTGTVTVDGGAFLESTGYISGQPSGSGKLRVGAAQAYLQNLSPATVRSQLNSAYDSGKWDGATGIFPTEPVAGNATIGYLAASLYTSYHKTSFINGVRLDVGTVVLPTVAGDTDLNGTVNFSDLLHLAKAYGATANAVWSDGDFDYNGTVDFADLLTLARHYSTAVGASDETGGLPAAFAADFALAQSLVPEPGLAALGAAALFGLVGRRR